MDRNKEYIIAAAYKLKPEFVTKSVVYKDKTVRLNDEDYDDINTIEIGRCHADIIHRHKDRIDQKDSLEMNPFWTSHFCYSLVCYL